MRQRFAGQTVARDHLERATARLGQHWDERHWDALQGEEILGRTRWQRNVRPLLAGPRGSFRQRRDGQDSSHMERGKRQRGRLSLGRTMRMDEEENGIYAIRVSSVFRELPVRPGGSRQSRHVVRIFRGHVSLRHRSRSFRYDLPRLTREATALKAVRHRPQSCTVLRFLARPYYLLP